MNPSISNSKTGTKTEMLNTITNFLMEPLGAMLSLSFGNEIKNHIGKIEENTFEIFSVASSAIVDGDTLINLFLGKTNLSNLKFK